MPIRNLLRVLLGGAEDAYDSVILSAVEVRAKKLVNQNGLRYADAVTSEIHIIADGGPSGVEAEQIRCYRGVQIEHRIARRLQA